MLTRCVDDQFKMLLTRFAILDTNSLYLITLASGISIQNMLPTKRRQHHEVTKNTHGAKPKVCLWKILTNCKPSSNFIEIEFDKPTGNSWRMRQCLEYWTMFYSLAPFKLSPKWPFKVGSTWILNHHFPHSTSS